MHRKPIKVKSLDELDVRKLDHDPDPEALDRAETLMGEIRERDLELARLFLRIHLKNAQYAKHASSIES